MRFFRFFRLFYVKKMPKKVPFFVLRRRNQKLICSNFLLKSYWFDIFYLFSRFWKVSCSVFFKIVENDQHQTLILRYFFCVNAFSIRGGVIGKNRKKNRACKCSNCKNKNRNIVMILSSKRASYHFLSFCYLW